MICVSPGWRPTETPVVSTDIGSSSSNSSHSSCKYAAAGAETYFQQHLWGIASPAPCRNCWLWESLLIPIGVQTKKKHHLIKGSRPADSPSDDKDPGISFVSFHQLIKQLYCLSRLDLYYLFQWLWLNVRGGIFSAFISMFSFRFWQVDRIKEKNLNYEIRNNRSTVIFSIFREGWSVNNEPI